MRAITAVVASNSLEMKYCAMSSRPQDARRGPAANSAAG